MTEPLIVTSGAARAALYGVAGAWWVFEGVMNIRQWRRAGRGPRRDPAYVLVYVCVAASVLVSQVLSLRGGLLWPGGRAWPVVAGLILIVACIAVRAWSINASSATPSAPTTTSSPPAANACCPASSDPAPPRPRRRAPGPSPRSPG